MNRKGENKRRSSSNIYGDVTINEFANSSSAKYRSKKSQLQLPIGSSREDLEWFEIDEEEFEDVEEQKLTHHVINQTNDVTSGDEGRTYPLDIWFLLSDYITPQSVKTFALLCHDSYYVTCTISFYKRMWRSYEPKSNLTELSRSICRNVDRSYLSVGCKAYRGSVIRALHHCYPPFCDLAPRTSPEAIHELEGARCVMQWHKLYNKQCIFNFKMKLPRTSLSRRLQSMKNEDLWWNPEDDFCLLQVVCENFIDLSRSQIGGLTLTKSYITMTSNMMRHKIKLVFHDTNKRLKPIPLSKYKETQGCVLVLCSVISHQVVQWWHRCYPFYNISNHR